MVWKWLTFGKAREALPNPARPQGGRADEAYRDIGQTDSPTLIGPAPKHKSTWALNQDEANYNPAASVVSFRTIGFRNLAHPDSPTEYLEADFLPDTQRWRLRQCTDGDGRALSAMFNRAAEGSTMQMAVHKSTTLVEKAAFMFVLQKMAVYEFGTDTASQYAMREVVDEDIGDSHFMGVAHAAGVIFDVNGHPSMTLNCRPMRDGQFPQSELDHAVAYNAHIQQKNVPILTLLRSTELVQGIPDSLGLDSFHDVSKLLKLKSKMDTVLEEMGDQRKRYFNRRYDSKMGDFVYSDAKWTELKCASFHGNFDGMINKIDQAKTLMKDEKQQKDTFDLLSDIKIMMQVLHATTLMQCYHNRASDSASAADVNFMVEAFEGADKALTDFDLFSDEKKKTIRSFILGKHSVDKCISILDSIAENTKSLGNVVQYRLNHLIQKSQESALLASEGNAIENGYNNVPEIPESLGCEQFREPSESWLMEESLYPEELKAVLRKPSPSAPSP
jgi:hypothetical protein